MFLSALDGFFGSAGGFIHLVVASSHIEKQEDTRRRMNHGCETLRIKSREHLNASGTKKNVSRLFIASGDLPHQHHPTPPPSLVAVLENEPVLFPYNTIQLANDRMNGRIPMFSVLLTSEGKLFRWGVEDGEVYRFPTGVCTQIPLPCVEISCGRKHTMALMKGGFVMTWGTGYFGQLGHGDNVSYRHPRLLRRLDPTRLGEKVVQVRTTRRRRRCGGVLTAVAAVAAVAGVVRTAEAAAGDKAGCFMAASLSFWCWRTCHC